MGHTNYESDYIDHLFHECIIEYKKLFTEHFENKHFGNDLNLIEFYFLINHYTSPVMIFFPKTGVYKGIYFKKTKEMRFDLCYDNIIKPTDINNAFNIFEPLLLMATEKLCSKCRDKKINFDTDNFYNIVKIILKDIKENQKYYSDNFPPGKFIF
jgi:hypothetical protein